MKTITQSRRSSLPINWAIRRPQVGPLNVWAQILTTDDTTSLAFYPRAVLGRDSGPKPLLHRLVGIQLKAILGSLEAAHDFDRSLEVACTLIHVRSLSQEKLAMQLFLAVTQENIAGRIG